MLGDAHQLVIACVTQSKQDVAALIWPCIDGSAIPTLTNDKQEDGTAQLRIQFTMCSTPAVTEPAAKANTLTLQDYVQGYPQMQTFGSLT